MRRTEKTEIHVQGVEDAAFNESSSLSLFNESKLKDSDWQNHKAECAGQKRRRLAHRSANVAMLEEIRLSGLLLLKKKAGSLRSATEIEKILRRGSQRLFSTLLRRKSRPALRRICAKDTFKSVRFAVAHKKWDILYRPCLLAFIFAQSVVSFTNAA